jgi:hypothetical protein
VVVWSDDVGHRDRKLAALAQVPLLVLGLVVLDTHLEVGLVLGLAVHVDEGMVDGRKVEGLGLLRQLLDELRCRRLKNLCILVELAAAIVAATPTAVEAVHAHRAWHVDSRVALSKGVDLILWNRTERPVELRFGYLPVIHLPRAHVLALRPLIPADAVGGVGVAERARKPVLTDAVLTSVRARGIVIIGIWTACASVFVTCLRLGLNE